MKFTVGDRVIIVSAVENFAMVRRFVGQRGTVLGVESTPFPFKVRIDDDNEGFGYRMLCKSEIRLLDPVEWLGELAHG